MLEEILRALGSKAVTGELSNFAWAMLILGSLAFAAITRRA